MLQCLLHIANIRRYWMFVDVVKNINTEEEQENYSCIDLDTWMTFFRSVLSLSLPMFSTAVPCCLSPASSSSCTVLENLKATVISFCTKYTSCQCFM